MTKKEEEKVVKRDEVVEETATVELNEKDSPSKAEFKALIETYKEQNPVKYAQKKDRLEAKLKSL